MSKPLAEALRKQGVAESNASLTLRGEYPVKSAVSWRKNGLHNGKVVAHGYGDRIRVQNSRTGKKYWIHAYDIVNAM